MVGLYLEAWSLKGNQGNVIDKDLEIKVVKLTITGLWSSNEK